MDGDVLPLQYFQHADVRRAASTAASQHQADALAIGVSNRCDSEQQRQHRARNQGPHFS
jgi:hypothetical protein